MENKKFVEPKDKEGARNNYKICKKCNGRGWLYGGSVQIFCENCNGQGHFVKENKWYNEIIKILID